MDPANAVKSAGAFKDGCVRIDTCVYKVHKGKAGEGDPPVPATKMSWLVTRLTEGGAEPLLDEHDEPIVEEILFSFGGKCLPFVHPGKGDSENDDEPEDLGTSEGTEGNTIFLNANDWKPNEKSGVMTLMKSLVSCQVGSEYINRCWAPDWVGCVLEMKSIKGEKGADGREFSYKVVTKILVGPGGGKKSKGGGKAAGAADPEAELGKILHLMGEELDGQSITLKAFLNRVRSAMETLKTDSKLLVPVLSLAKDTKWLAVHAETFAYTLNTVDNTIAFTTIPF